MNGMGLGQLGGLGRLGQSTLTAGKWPSWMADMDMGWDFVQGRKYASLDPTDTHAASIYAPNAAGLYTPYAANVLTRTDLGLQTVPTRTNSVRNNSNTGAVVGTPGTFPTNWSRTASGLSVNVVGFGTANGLPYIDIQFVGTTSGTNGLIDTDTTTGIAALNGQTWTNSMFLSVVGGSLANVTTVVLADRVATGAGALLSTIAGSDFKASLSSSPQRFALTGTISDATAGAILQRCLFSWSSGVAIDFTLRMSAVQMEQGAFASPPILTTAAAAAVAGNQQVISLPTQLAVGVAGVVQVKLLQLTAGNNERIIDINDGTASNRVLFSFAATGYQFIVTNGGVAQTGTTDASSSAVGDVLTVAFAASENFSTYRIVGRAAVSPDTVVSFPVINKVALCGTGYDVTRNNYAYTRKLALKFGPQDAGTFAQMYALAQIAAAS